MFLSSVCHIWADEKFTFFLNSFFLLHSVEKNLRQIFQLFIYACKLDIVEENGFLIVQFFDNNQRNFFSLFFKSAIIFLKQQKKMLT